MSTVASYCTTFLKPEMLHIYRQVTGLQRHRTFILTKQRQCAEKFPFPDIEVIPPAGSHFLRRFHLKYIRREPPLVYRGEYRTLTGILDRRRPDLLHIYFGHTGVHLLPFLQHHRRLPALVSFHGADVMPRADRPGYLDRLRELLQTVPLVLARSLSLRDRLLDLGCPEGKIRLNRTGIPMDSFPVAADRAFPTDGRWHFVQACRLIEKKGLNLALTAFAAFCKTWPESTFTIAGEGPMREELGDLARSLGIGEKVIFTGFLDTPALCRLYHQSHAFLHPSQMPSDQNQEGIPNSMLEAMATGLPVLATHHGGIPEAVTDHVTGLLVEERDSDRFLDNLQLLAREPALWEALSRNAARDVRGNFEHRAQIACLEGIYDELLTLSPPAA
ncbi:MAG: glycosyl transferase [Verrucomicrobiales bacterium]|nr:glycosyl transferase [Verrucomicrobiales bacterium]